MRQGVRQVCPVKKAFGFFSRRRRTMPFAVRFVRRRRTQQKKHKGLRQGGCANLRRKMACRLCFALPRCAHVKKTEGRSAARRYALRPLALAKWRQHLPRGFCAELLGGDIFCHYGERPRPFCPDDVAQFEQCARGRGRHVRTASRQSAACNNAPAFAVLFADDLRRHKRYAPCAACASSRCAAATL